MEKKRVYFAAPLFNWPDKSFNLRLTEKLEQRGYGVILPQRDGFEFAKLKEALKGILDENSIENAVNQLIYLLDKGWLLGRSDFCVACLDEPIDEGVVDEINFSKLIQIPVVGVRTDIRSPYGPAENEVRGMHFFPAYTCDKFILTNLGFTNSREEDSQLEKLAARVDLSLRSMDSERNHPHPFAKKIISTAEKLFSEIPDIHSQEGLKALAGKYSLLQAYINEQILPEIIRT